MVNLLPLREKKVLRGEYRRRLIVLILKGIFILAAAAAFIILPARVRLAISGQTINERLQGLEAGRASGLEKEVRTSVADINQKLAIFTFKLEWNFSGEIMKPILDRRGAGIRLDSIFMEKAPKTIMAKLRGRAADREKLLAFLRRLEAAPEFARVDLPISNFVKGRDIEFGMDITMSEKK